MSKKKYVNVGILCKRREGGFYIKLDKDVKVTIDGDNVTGGFISVNSPLDKFDKMVAKAERQLAEGEIDQAVYDEVLEKAESQAARFNDGGDLEYIRQNLTYVRKD